MRAAARLAFGPWLLDTCGRSLTRDNARVALSPYQYQVLHLLVQRAWEVRSKDALILAGWRDIAVGDDSLEILIGQLRPAPRCVAGLPRGRGAVECAFCVTSASPRSP